MILTNSYKTDIINKIIKEIQNNINKMCFMSPGYEILIQLIVKYDIFVDFIAEKLIDNILNIIKHKYGSKVLSYIFGRYKYFKKNNKDLNTDNIEIIINILYSNSRILYKNRYVKNILQDLKYCLVLEEDEKDRDKEYEEDNIKEIENEFKNQLDINGKIDRKCFNRISKLIKYTEYDIYNFIIFLKDYLIILLQDSKYGCRLVKVILFNISDFMDEDSVNEYLQVFIGYFKTLLSSQIGCEIILAIIEFRFNNISKICCNELIDDMFHLSTTFFGHQILDKLISYCFVEELDLIAKKLINFIYLGKRNIAKNKYGYLILQHITSYCSSNPYQCRLISNIIKLKDILKLDRKDLLRNMYGKYIINSIDQNEIDGLGSIIERW
jgi:hypothetical protein